jgi:hypothetical protein
MEAAFAAVAAVTAAVSQMESQLNTITNPLSSLADSLQSSPNPDTNPNPILLSTTATTPNKKIMRKSTSMKGISAYFATEVEKEKEKVGGGGTGGNQAIVGSAGVGGTGLYRRPPQPPGGKDKRRAMIREAPFSFAFDDQDVIEEV